MKLDVGGIKGGTDKSTVAMNLAVWLALEGEDVVLLDADRDHDKPEKSDQKKERLTESVYSNPCITQLRQGKMGQKSGAYTKQVSILSSSLTLPWQVGHGLNTGSEGTMISLKPTEMGQVKRIAEAEDRKFAHMLRRWIKQWIEEWDG